MAVFRKIVVERCSCLWCLPFIPLINLLVISLSSNFREATKIVSVALPTVNMVRWGSIRIILSLWSAETKSWSHFRTECTLWNKCKRYKLYKRWDHSKNSLYVRLTPIDMLPGKYLPGLQPPFDAGFEAVGRIASIGDGVTGFKVGDPVVYSSFGAFSEIKEVITCCG